jgi:hypothetical protein
MFGEAKAKVAEVAILAAVWANEENPAEQHFQKSLSSGLENPGAAATRANWRLVVRKHELHCRALGLF